MPGYTSPLNIPYPVASDAMRDAVSTIPQSQAEKIDDLLSAITSVNPVAYTALAHVNSWAPQAEGSAYARTAGMVTLIIKAAKTTWVGGEAIVVLPAGFRPPASRGDLYFTAFRSSDGAPVGLRLISSTGQVVTVLGATGGNALQGTISFGV